MCSDHNFDGDLGGLLPVLLFNIDPARPEVARWIWIMEGDTPLASLTLEDTKSPTEVFSTYVQGMTKWVQPRQGNRGRRSASERSRNTEMGRKA